MFAENFKSKALELSRIKNLSEFGLNLDECRIIFSKDLKYGVIYTETFVSIVDMNKKKFTSKLSCEENARISKLKVTHKNNVTYLKRTNDYINLVISSINFIGYFFEFRVPYDIVDYVYIEANPDDDNQDYIFLITSKGELEFCYLRHQIEKKRVNISKDSGNKLRPGFEVNYMDFIEETKNLIIVMANGAIINYTVSFDPESESAFNLQTISYEETLHLDHYEYLNDKTITSKKTKNYDVTTFKITKFVFGLEEFIIKDQEESEIGMKKEMNQPKQSVFLVIGFTKNKYDTYISFYEIQSNQMVFLNRIELKGKVTLDSCIYQTKNRELNGKVPDYFILCCRVISSNKVQILASDFLECLKNPGVREGMMEIENEERDQSEDNIFTLVNEFDDSNNSIKNLGIIGVYIVKNMDYLMRSKFEKNFDFKNKGNEDENKSVSLISNINDYKYLEYSLELIVRKLVTFSAFDVYIIDSDIQQDSFTPSKKFSKNILQNNVEKYIQSYDEKELRNAMTGDVNKHLEFFEKNNSNDIIFKFRSQVISLISENSIYKTFPMGNKNIISDNRVDFYLLLLLFHDDLFSIKYYLCLHENITTRQFLVSNDKLYHTVNDVVFSYLKDLIYNNLKAPVIDYEFFTSDKVFSNLNTIRHLMQISKTRCENPYDRPFKFESEIISEETLMIQNVIFEVESIILIMKIIRSYLHNVVKGEESVDRIVQIITDSVRNKKEMRKQKSSRDVTYFELIMMNPQHEIYPNWKKFFANFVHKMTMEGGYSINSSSSHCTLQNQYQNTSVDAGKNIEGAYFEDILNFTKLQFFFYYFYFVLDYQKLWKERESEKMNMLGNSFAFEYNLLDEKGVRTYFQEMKEEYNSFFNICFNFYKLDMNLAISSGDKKSGLITPNVIKVDITTISNFLINFNKSNIAKTPYFRDYLNVLKINLNSMLIRLLFTDRYCNEALVLSKNIISLVTEYEDMQTQLSLLLDMKLVNLAYQYVNNCFAMLVCFSEGLDVDSNYENKNLLEAVVRSPEYQQMKELYFYFFEFLIRNNYISLLFSLPYNFIERSLLKEFLSVGKKEYEDLLLLYFINLKKVNEAENLFIDYQKSTNYSDDSKQLYSNIIETLKILYGELGKEKVHQVCNKMDSSKLYVEVNINQEKERLAEIKSPSFEMKNVNEVAVNILYDSIMDIENIPYKPSNVSLNDTIKSLLSRKQETAKKTFGFLTDIKPVKRGDYDFGSERLERNFFDNTKFKSFIGLSRSPQNKTDFTPLKKDVKPLVFTSNISLKNQSMEKEKDRNIFDEMK